MKYLLACGCQCYHAWRETRAVSTAGPKKQIERNRNRHPCLQANVACNPPLLYTFIGKRHTFARSLSVNHLLLSTHVTPEPRCEDACFRALARAVVSCLLIPEMPSHFIHITDAVADVCPVLRRMRLVGLDGAPMPFAENVIGTLLAGPAVDMAADTLVPVFKV